MKKQLIFLGILAILCFCILRGAFADMQQLEQLYTGWSVRFEAAIDANRAQQLKRYCAEHAEENGGIWPGFWAETKADAKADRAEEKTAVFSYDGDPARLFPVTMLSGSYPGELEETRCAVSSGLSWSLWGSLDTAGQILTIGGQTYTVSGVFSQEEAQVLLKGDADTLWTAMDLVSEKELMREDVTQFIAEAGLPPAENLVDGNGITGLARLGIYTPLMVATLMALLLFFFKKQQGHGKTLKSLLLLALLLGLAWGLPLLLGLLPQWLVPTKWSDFSFWTALVEKCKGYLLQWQSLHPASRDVAAKKVLFSLGINTATMLMLLPVFYHRLKEILGYAPAADGERVSATTGDYQSPMA